MWQVVLEAPEGVDLPPKVWSEHASLAGAKRAAVRFAVMTGPHSGIKVNVCNTESADQLQVYGAHKDKAVREQPELAAVGQDLTVIASTAMATVDRPFWKPRG